MKRQGVALFALAVLVLSGCLSEPPKLDPVFRVDEIRYWWEDDEFLVVNVTFTNIQNFTTGKDAANPWLDVRVFEYERTDEPATGYAYDGPIYKGVSSRDGLNKYTIYFDSTGNHPWQERWYDDKVVEAGRANYTDPILAPVQIAPNESYSPTIVFRPSNHYTGLDGYYAIEVQLMQDYPRSMKEGHSTDAWVDYYTGCFNHDTPEFYGYQEDTGRVCTRWDCTGEGLSQLNVERKVGETKPEHRADCPATDAVGPYYDDP